MTGALHGLALGAPASVGTNAPVNVVAPLLPGAIPMPPIVPNDAGNDQLPVDPQDELEALRATVALYEAERAANQLGVAGATSLFLDPAGLQLLRTAAASARDEKKAAELPKIVPGFKANPLHIGVHRSHLSRTAVWSDRLFLLQWAIGSGDRPPPWAIGHYF